MIKDEKHSALVLTPNVSESQQKDNDLEEGNWANELHDAPRQCPSCCSRAFLAGFTIAALLLGVVFATILTLYLFKPVCTMTTTRSTTTTSTSTTTTSTSSSTSTSTTTSTTTTTTSTSTSTSTTTTTTTSASTSTTTNAAFNINLIKNGNAENGSCQAGGGITSPREWSVNGAITQVLYNNSVAGGIIRTTDAGPSDRGRCYFYGQLAGFTSMWQTINLTNQVSPVLIDSQTVKFNLSAWIGGFTTQNDTAEVSVSFIDANNQMVGNSTTIGPVFASERSSQTSLIFQQATDLVPIGARSMTVFVMIYRSVGTWNQGSVDNIAVVLSQ